MLGVVDMAWVTEKGDSRDALNFAKYFGKCPDKLSPKRTSNLLTCQQSRSPGSLNQ
jgi:hypothetical protein